MRAVMDGFLSRGPFAVGLMLLLTHGACSRGEEGSQKGAPDAGNGAVAVDVKEVQRGRLRAPLTLVGTTQPVQEVAVRARVEGHLETLTVDVGDSVSTDQELGRQDPTLLDAAVHEAEAALAGARAEAASAEAGVAQAKSALEQSRLAAAQAEVEARRYESLAERGISSRQEAEQRATAARTAQQAVQAASQQVLTQQSLATAAQSRIRAQEALLAAAKERRSFATLRSPLSGRVMARFHSPGDVVLAGAEVLRVGDFSQVEVAVSVSELELSRVKPGQKVPVRIDAFGDTSFTGTVARVSPQADPVSRLVPLEVVLENPEGRIGSGLLARVRFENGVQEQLLLLESALIVGLGGPGDGGQPAPSAEGRVFVVKGGESGSAPQVEAREVRVGARADGQAEILSGLQEGERVVVRSQRPLQSGTEVRPSALSDSGPQGVGGGGRE
ncbi:efflux RND transporter periplasmic adaptor subunit [Hyalangium rubrum]|uniref:Efflux RND transporter periplasmic adaptor subunit n=1 Tax=Hyalangium rubrum TaxID=3103134 RepID=A0ABU5H7T0_9BACT|nr:efflux RND transporter periplasmic adaptor subunit [Hyalangium sp. s54d21]MDY7229517.1 efflux RND transporter periplasmic adaptor subunit [Hyalangium sp. s54d21]